MYYREQLTEKEIDFIERSLEKSKSGILGDHSNSNFIKVFLGGHLDYKKIVIYFYNRYGKYTSYNFIFSDLVPLKIVLDTVVKEVRAIKYMTGRTNLEFSDEITG